MCFKYPFDVYKCGKCPECLQDLRREWSIRLQLHTSFSDHVPFYAHLTYDNDHVPINEYGKLTLCKRDVQLFIKRLRQKLNKLNEQDKIQNFKGFKYYIAGEYGDRGTHRPHYHCILFGLPENYTEKENIQLLQETWLNGFVRYTSCWLKDYAQIHYATKYIINYFEEDFEHKVKPFRLLSSGIGKEFIDFALESNLYDFETQLKFTCDKAIRKLNNQVVAVRWHDEQPLIFDTANSCWKVNPLLDNFRDFIEFESVVKGKPKVRRYPLPRYFKERLYTQDFRIALAEVKKFKLSNKNLDYYEKYSTYDMSEKTPMWLELKRYTWEMKKKNKKDKKLHSFNNSLND